MPWEIIDAVRSAKCNKCGQVWSFAGPVTFDEARSALLECGWNVITVRGPFRQHREGDGQVCPVCVGGGNG